MAGNVYRGDREWCDLNPSGVPCDSDNKVHVLPFLHPDITNVTGCGALRQV